MIWLFGHKALPLRVQVLTLGLIAGVGIAAISAKPAFAQDLLERYVELQSAASQAFQQGELSKAIEAYEQALAIAPNQVKAAARNNLAVTYIRRANYYSHVNKNNELALPDYRTALYLLDYGWPPVLKKETLHLDNAAIAKKNVDFVYRRMNLVVNGKAPHLQMASDLRQKGELRQAVVEYELALEETPDAQEALKGLGVLYNVLNEPELSVHAYERALAVLKQQSKPAPYDELLVGMANSLKRMNEPTRAAEALNQALEQNPANPTALTLLEQLWRDELRKNQDNPLAHANLARVFQYQKRYPLALSAYQNTERLLQRTPTTSLDLKKQVRFNMATLFQEMNNLPMAEQAYQSILAVEPNDKEALTGLAQVYTNQKQPQKALDVFYKVLDANPANAMAVHAELLKAIQTLPSDAQVEAELERYANRYSNMAFVQASVGETYHQAKRYQNAVQRYQKAVALSPQDAGTWANLGLALQELGDAEKSRQALQKALALEPNNSVVKERLEGAEEQDAYAAYERGVALLEADANSAEGLSLLKKAVSLEPENENYQLVLAVSLQQQNKLNEAVAAYTKIIAANPQNAKAFLYRGSAYDELKQSDKAEADYKQALRLEPQNNEAQQALAAMQANKSALALEAVAEAYEANQYQKVLTLSKPLLALPTPEPMALYYQGLAYNGLNRHQDAISSLKSALAARPDLINAHYALGVAYDATQQKPLAKQAYQAFVDGVKQLDPTEQDSLDSLTSYANERISAL